MSLLRMTPLCASLEVQNASVSSQIDFPWKVQRQSMPLHDCMRESDSMRRELENTHTNPAVNMFGPPIIREILHVSWGSAPIKRMVGPIWMLTILR